MPIGASFDEEDLLQKGHGSGVYQNLQARLSSATVKRRSHANSSNAASRLSSSSSDSFAGAALTRSTSSDVTHLVPPHRQLLERIYHVDGLPPDLAHRVFPNMKTATVSLMSEMHETETAFEKEVIRTVLSDQVTVSKEEREKIAKSLLTGNYEIRSSAPLSATHSHSSLPSPHPLTGPHTLSHAHTHAHTLTHTQSEAALARAREAARTKEKLLFLQRHQLPRQHFLEIMTESAEIPVLSGKEITQRKVQRLRELTHTDTLTHVKLSPRVAMESEPSISSPTHAQTQTQTQAKDAKRVLIPSPHAFAHFSESLSLKNNKTQSHAVQSTFAKMIKSEKEREVKKIKEDLERKKEQSKRQRAFDRLTAEKKAEVRKKIQDFRQKLRDHLQKKRDPMAGEIMRVVDDSMVFYLLQKYDGFEISPEGVLSLLQSHLGLSVLDPYAARVPLNEGEREDPATSFLTDVPGQSSAQLPLRDSHTAAPVQLPLMEAHPHAASLSAEKSYASLQCNYKAFGRRESPPVSPSRTAQRADRFGRDFDETEQFSTAPKRNEDPVMGFAPRRFDHDFPSTQGKTLAGGFRVRPNSPLPLDRSPSPHHGNSGEREPLLVMSSERVRSVMQKMGFDPRQAERDWRRESALRERAPSAEEEMDVVDNLPRRIDSQQSMTSLLARSLMQGSLSQETHSAIAAMHGQLLQEGLLQSLEPEVVLDPKRIEELGTRRKPFETIEKELKQEKQKVVFTDSVLNTFSEATPMPTGVSEWDSKIFTSQKKEPVVIDDPVAAAEAEAIERDIAAVREEEKLKEQLAKESSGNEGKAEEQHHDSPDIHQLGSSLEANQVIEIANSPPKTLPLHGTVVYLQSEVDEERLSILSELERQRGEDRLIFPTLRPLNTDKYQSFLAEFPDLNEPSSRPRSSEPWRKAPPIKSQAKYAERNGLQGLPVSPFNSWAEETKVLNTGIPAGAGLMLWRPRDSVTLSGRYRVGRHEPKNKLKGSAEGKPRPFISVT